MSNKVARQQLQIRQVFDSFREGKNFLDRQDVQYAASTLLGSRPTKHEVGRWLGMAGEERMRTTEGLTEDAPEGLTLEEFSGIMARQMEAVDDREELRHIFQAFDVGCRGFITLPDLQRVMAEVFPSMPLRRVAQLFVAADTEGAGRIGYHRFEQLMRIPM